MSTAGWKTKVPTTNCLSEGRQGHFRWPGGRKARQGGLSKVTRRGTEKWKASLKRWLQYPAKRLCCLRDYELHGFLQGTLSDWPIACSHSNSNWKHTQSVTWPVFNLGEQRALQSSVRHIYWKPTVFQVQWWIRCLTWKLWAARGPSWDAHLITR